MMHTIGEVTISENGLATLEKFQEDNCSCIEEYISELSEAVCFLSKTQLHLDGSFKDESSNIMMKLSFIRDDLKTLKTT